MMPFSTALPASPSASSFSFASTSRAVSFKLSNSTTFVPTNNAMPTNSTAEFSASNHPSSKKTIKEIVD